MPRRSFKETVKLVFTRVCVGVCLFVRAWISVSVCVCACVCVCLFVRAWISVSVCVCVGVCVCEYT